jgi:hypothetical protein
MPERVLDLPRTVSIVDHHRDRPHRVGCEDRGRGFRPAFEEYGDPITWRDTSSCERDGERLCSAGQLRVVHDVFTADEGREMTAPLGCLPQAGRQIAVVHEENLPMLVRHEV